MSRFTINLKKAICRTVNIRRRRIIEKEWIPFLSLNRDEIKKEQLCRLRSLLVHAGKWVPYYRECFEKTGFQPALISDVSELRILPILTKEIIREQGDRLLAENFATHRFIEKSTGGSTGEALVFYRHAEYLKSAMYGTFRNFTLCGWRPGDPVANFWGINDVFAFKIRGLKEEINYGYHTFNAFDAGDAQFVDWAERLKSIKPVAWYGYASTIWLFCKWLADHSMQYDKPKELCGVFVTAEKFHDFQRSLIENVLGVPVFNLYGSTEVQNISFECRAGSMHIAEDFVVVENMLKPLNAEIVKGGDVERSHQDESGNSTLTEKDNVDGRNELLLTSLRNYAMPFIRYKNGDEGRMVDGVCSCGIHAPCMAIDVGRECDNFQTTSGRVIHGEFFTHTMGGIRGIRTFQFRQTEKHQVVLSVVADKPDDQTVKTAVEAVSRKIKAGSGGEFDLDVAWVDAIPLSNRGKHVFTIGKG